MLNQTKYARWYLMIIDRAEKRTKPEGYSESHHKVPKSIGGSHRRNNLVSLTAREHLLSHYLLSKAMVDPEHTLKMKRALSMMLIKSKKHIGRDRLTCRRYEELRRACADSSPLKEAKNRFDPSKADEAYRQNMSEKMKGREVPWRKGAADSDETRLKKSIAGKTKVFTNAHREALSLAAKKRWAAKTQQPNQSCR